MKPLVTLVLLLAATGIAGLGVLGGARADTAQGFTVSIDPVTQTVTQGGSATYGITVTPFGGFSGHLDFSLLGPPAGVNATFATSAPYSLHLIATDTAPGSYPITIRVADDSGTIWQEAIGTLDVASNAGPALTTGGGDPHAGPDIVITLSGADDPAAIGKDLTIVGNLSNVGIDADTSTLKVQVTGLQLVASRLDRGPGCSGTTGTITCDLGPLRGGVTATETFDLLVTSLPASLSMWVASTPAGPMAPATWYADGPAPDAGTTTTTATTAGAPPTTATVSTAVSHPYSLKAPKRVTLRAGVPKLPLTLMLSRAATVALTLFDSKGRVVMSWKRTVEPGTSNLTLVLPMSLRKPGAMTLRVSVPGAAPRVVKVALHA